MTTKTSLTYNLNRLRQSILKKAFEGNLVPQDPADEPAEKLLEKIRQARGQTVNNRNLKTKSKNIRGNRTSAII